MCLQNSSKHPTHFYQQHHTILLSEVHMRALQSNVVDKLAALLLLETMFIRTFIKGTLPMARYVVPIISCAVESTSECSPDLDLWKWYSLMKTLKAVQTTKQTAETKHHFLNLKRMAIPPCSEGSVSNISSVQRQKWRAPHLSCIRIRMLLPSWRTFEAIQNRANCYTHLEFHEEPYNLAGNNGQSATKLTCWSLSSILVQGKTTLTERGPAGRVGVLQTPIAVHQYVKRFTNWTEVKCINKSNHRSQRSGQKSG